MAVSGDGAVVVVVPGAVELEDPASGEGPAREEPPQAAATTVTAVRSGRMRRSHLGPWSLVIAKGVGFTLPTSRRHYTAAIGDAGLLGDTRTSPTYQKPPERLLTIDS